jgi:hypothetical protein
MATTPYWFAPCLLYLLELAIIGGCGFIEHPQWPVWAVSHDPASIWATMQARLCKTLHCCSVVGFDQCIVGARAKKTHDVAALALGFLQT